MRQEHIAQTFQTRHALLRSLVPHYQQASAAQKTLLLDTFVEWTGYTRKHAIKLLNHGDHDQQTIKRQRQPQYGQEVQHALFLVWKAAHYVCAKRLLPSLPTLVALLERHGHLHLVEEERRQLMKMSMSTAERYLRTQRKPCLHGLATTTPGSLSKSQIPLCIYAPWEENRPGFVEVDLVAHCGDHLDGCFLYTMTLTDLATCWTECIPLREKSADAVQAALEQARTLFPFPLLGIDTDNGSEFLNEQVITSCEQHHLTFTRGRSGIKNDQAHVEQKNRSIVREAVGCVRLEDGLAYRLLGEVYRTLRLVVNGFQPSFKLQARVVQEDRIRRVYDEAQTPLQRVLASGVLAEEQQQELSMWVQQIDPLALSEHLDALRSTLFCAAQVSSIAAASGLAWLPCSFSLALCLSGTRPRSEEGHVESPPAEPLSCQEAVSDADFSMTQPQPLLALMNDAAKETVEIYEEHLITIQQAMTLYLQEMRACGRSRKTLEWHHTSLRTLQHYLWKRYHLMEIRHLSQECLQTWVTDLPLMPSARTGRRRAVSTAATYARSARAFCHWLVQQGYVSEPLFPSDAIPDIPPGQLHVVEPELFARLLRACSLQGLFESHAACVQARNRALLWLLWETGLQVSELCDLRLANVDRVSGSITVQGKRGSLRTFPLSADGKRALETYLDQVRLTPAWESAIPEAQDRLFLTEQRRPLIKNSLTGLFQRLNLRAGFARTFLCPSMLRETYAIRFLQAGGTLAALQHQLGIVHLPSMKRYEHFSEKHRHSGSRGSTISTVSFGEPEQGARER